MKRQPRRDTKAEMVVRRAVWHRGLRYRVDLAPVRGMRRRADLVFTRAKVAVFVDGCFWHRCPEHATAPKSNAVWWAEKLAANVQRDRDTDARLRDAGWIVVRVWEHDDAEQAADLIESVVRSRSDRATEATVTAEHDGDK